MVTFNSFVVRYETVVYALFQHGLQKSVVWEIFEIFIKTDMITKNQKNLPL